MGQSNLMGCERREPALGWNVKWPYELGRSLWKDSYEKGGIVRRDRAIWNFEFRISNQRVIS